MTRLIDSTPRADGFRMPGEFEPHAQTWMLWPQRPDNWRLGGKPAQRSWVEVATAISRFEPVTVGVNHDQYENAVNLLPEAVRVVELSSNDAWMRDCGPTFVVNDQGDVRLVDWDFNACGGLYDGLYFPWDKDQTIPQKIAQMERVDRYKALEMCMPYAKAVSVKCTDFDEKGNHAEWDLPRMIQITMDAGYRGFMGIEAGSRNMRHYDNVRACRDLLRKFKA